MLRATVLTIAILTPCYKAIGATHCEPNEVVYFSCKIKGSSKIVSLCGSPLGGTHPDQFRRNGWLQYRFGSPGSKLELAFPTEKWGSAREFKGESHSFLGERNVRNYNSRVWFRNQAIDYGLVVDEGEQHFVGVWVLIGDTRKSLPCRTGANDISLGHGNSDGSTFTSLIQALEPIE